MGIKGFTLPEWQGFDDARLYRPYYPDVERLAILTGRYREMARAAVADYRAWKEEIAENREFFGRCYALYEGQYLRARVRDSWRIYRDVRGELHRMQKFYKAEIMKIRA